MVDSQVEILKSETIASAVIKNLHLMDTDEFTGSDGGLLGRLSLSALFSSLFPESRPSPSDDQPLRAAVNRLEAN